MIEKYLTAFNLALENGVFVISAEKLENLHVPPFPPTVDAIILNVTNTEHVCNLLQANYSPFAEMPVVIGDSVQNGPLRGLSELERVDALYVPARKGYSFAEDFQEVVAHLRAPEGCPWDREQTHDSLRVFVLEEVYELLDALDAKNYQEVAEELGDVMLQIFLHAQVAVEEQEFNLVDVFTTISNKMRRRHPHVFSTVEVNGDVDQVLTNWQEIKAQERKENGDEKKKGALDGVSKNLPALLQAQHYQQRAILNGFDWDTEEGAFDKVREEIDEVLNAQTKNERSEEFGDLMFSLVRVITNAGFEAEVVLREANQKFYQRYTRLEDALVLRGLNLQEMTEEEKIVLWKSVK